MVLGITGCPGSGKSILANIVARHGWMLIDADEIGREVGENNHGVLDELADVFGADIINSEGKLDRRLLAVRAFSHRSKTRMLNEIVHTRLIERLKTKISDIRSQNNDCVVDCALIIEWGIEKLFDIVVCVASDEHLRKKRLIDRDGRTPEEINGMFAAQLSEDEKIKKADIVINNKESIEKLTLFGKMLSGLPGYCDGGGDG